MTEDEWHADAMRLADYIAVAFSDRAPYAERKACLEALAVHLRSRPDNVAIALLKDALAESLRLQSHYAKLLNMYDGGQRLGFDSVDAWLNRLAVLADKEPK